MANGVSDLERGIAAALPSSPGLTPEGILSFAKDNPATVATGALSLVDMAGGLGKLAGSSTPIGILANIGKALISGQLRDLVPFGGSFFPTETERAMEESRSTPLGRAAILADYQRNYGEDAPSAPDPLVSPANQAPTTTGGLPAPGPVQTQPLGLPAALQTTRGGLPPMAPIGMASLGSPFAGPGVGIFGTPSYTDAADVFGESSPYGGMGAPAAYDPEAAAYGLGDGGDDGMDGDLTGGYGEGGI